jgi:hypothetical protein
MFEMKLLFINLIIVDWGQLKVWEFSCNL